MAWKHKQFTLFCLKFFTLEISFINHTWRHWNKRVFPCSKCLLHLLKPKENTEHQTNNHHSKSQNNCKGCLLKQRSWSKLQFSWGWVDFPKRDSIHHCEEHWLPSATQKNYKEDWLGTQTTPDVLQQGIWLKIMFYPPAEIQKSPIEVQPAVHKDPPWLLLFSCSVMSDSLWPYKLQYTRLPCPSPSPEACSNSFHWVANASQPSCPLSPLVLLPSIFPSIRVFSNKLTLPIRWPNYWSFSISSSTELSGLISLRIDCLDLLAVQGTFQSLLHSPGPQFKQINSSAFNLQSSSSICIWLLGKP